MPMNRKRRVRRRILLVTLFVVLPLLIYLFMRTSVSPVIQEVAKARVSNRASYIINEAVEAFLREEEVDYDSIILLEKDVYGNITALRTNMNEINHLKTSVLAVVDTMLLDLDINEIGIPLGSVVLPEFFSGSGPKLPVKIVSISSSDAEFLNHFEEAGINQTLQRILMRVIINMTVLTPVGPESVSASSEVVVAETVIVGSVPDSYVNVDQALSDQ